MTRIRDLLPDPLYLAIQYHQQFGRWPNILNPKTFNEKLLCRKFRNKNSLLPPLVDKIAVKEIVAQRLGAKWVTPTLWKGAALPARDQRDWEPPYVIKANHGSGFNYFVHTEADEDWQVIEDKCAQWLKQKYGYKQRGWPYLAVIPQLFVEPFIGGGTSPPDYKFFVFNGRVAYIQVDTDRYSHHKRTMFNRTWERQPFNYIYESDPRDQARPKALDEMIAGAESLGADLDFVRVDLYDVSDEPRFGELTSFPEGGYGRFAPQDYDLKLGELWG